MNRKRILSATVLLLTAACFERCTGSVIVTVNNHARFPDHAVTVCPGDAFDIDINVQATQQFYHFDGVRLRASEADVFEILDGPTPPGPLDPSTPWFGDMSIGILGTYTLADFQLSVLTDARPGGYALNIEGGMYIPCPMCPAFAYAEPGPSFVVTVVPEPSSLFLVGIGAAVCLRRGRFGVMSRVWRR